MDDKHTNNHTETHACDSISRWAAIRWVKTECNPYGKPTLDFESGKKVIKHLEQMPSAQPAEVDVQKMQDLEQAEIQKAYELGKLDAMEEMPHWIPCSERLPDLDEEGFSEKMLVSFSNFSGLEICEYRETDEEHGWYVGDSAENPEDVGVHVIAWMPLPELYRKEEKHD